MVTIINKKDKGKPKFKPATEDAQHPSVSLDRFSQACLLIAIAKKLGINIQEVIKKND